MQRELINFLKKYASKKSVFKSKKVFQASYKPEEIIHRKKLISEITKMLAPLVNRDKPSNIFIYGTTGAGKTLSVKTVTDSFKQIIKTENAPLKIIYINCKLKRVSDTEYRLIAQLSRELGRNLPITGLPTDEVYNHFYRTLDQSEKPLLIVLDEIDQLTKKTGSAALYNLTRINEELTRTFISLVGISNDMTFLDGLDPRVKSSLSEESILFPSYNATQIQDILTKRSELGFVPNAIQEGVIPKCSANAAREHGDARRAIELLRVAGEIADREGSDKVSLKHVDQAEEKIDRDKIIEAVATQPKQAQATILSILLTNENSTAPIFTGSVYELYKSICKKAGLRPLTQRRVSDILSEMDMLGIITAKVISKGRYGRTREMMIPSSLNTDKVKKLLQDSLCL